MDCSEGTLEDSERCVFLPNHCCLVGCYMDEVFIEGYMEIIVEVYAGKSPNPE